MMNGDQPTTDESGQQGVAGNVPTNLPEATAPCDSGLKNTEASGETTGSPTDGSPSCPPADVGASPASQAQSESPAVPEIPATEVAANAPQIQASEVQATSSEVAELPSESKVEEKKVLLNPTVSGADLRAVPTYGAPDSATAGDPAAAHMQPPPSGPVELPQDSPMNPELDAELSAAMAETLSSGPSTPSGEATGTIAQMPISEDEIEPGAKLKAKVQSVGAENVFCDIGFRSPGLLPVKQFPPGKQPREGEEFLVVVDRHDLENGVVMVSLPKATRRPRGNWEELAVGQIVECVVNKTNKGGLEVTVSNMRAFLPASQVDVGFVSSLDSYVGQRFPVQVTEVNPAKRNLVVSRRVLVIEERKELAATFWESVEVGQQFSGTVKTIKDYGAFIDLGGVDGFLHVGEMSWTRIKHPSDLLAEGQAVDVVVLSLDREKHKIGLGMRQLAQNPWNLAVANYPVDSKVTGRVTRTADFGAFVELEPGVEGLIHISELEHRRVKRVGEVLNVGQEVEAQVLEVNPDRQRISLSLKALKAKPEEPKDEDLSPGKGQAYERKRKEPLRGGTGGGLGGGLFGNPTDFTK